MDSRQRWQTVLVTLGLATAMHLDWHTARPVIYHLSLGWQWHWLLAVPVFALTALFILRTSPGRLVGASVAIIGVATFLAGVVEPAWEYWIDGAPFEWTFGRMRLMPLVEFMAAGIVTHAIVLLLSTRRAASSSVARH